jgi:predicted alpha/beta superfamily hydrolase
MKNIERLSIGGRGVDIYLPPSYSTSTKRYPVVYVPGGGALIKHCVNHLYRLYLEGWLPELILAGVETYGGQTESIPRADESDAGGVLVPGGEEARAFIDELADRIKPYLDDHYRTIQDGKRTAIVGSSADALPPLFAAYFRPAAFGNIGLLSPALGYDRLMEFICAQPALSGHLRVFLSAGAQEGLQERQASRSKAGLTLELRRLWQSQGLAGDQLAFELEEEGTHDTMFIAGQFPKALLWLYGGEAERPLKPVRDMKDTGVTASMRYELPRTETFRLRAECSGLTYCIFVSQPLRPAPAEGYPVLYALDGNAYFGSLAEAMGMQAWHPEGIAPGLIVGIGYDSEEPFVYGRRMYDFTTDTPESEIRSDGMAWPPTGGADSFLEFLEQDLLPQIQSRYTVDRSRQSLFGHSLGGLFSLYALFGRPSPFRSFIAGSPSIWWNNYALLHRLPEFEERLAQGADLTELIIAVGSEEDPSMIEDALLLYQRLQPYSGQGLALSYMLIEGEDHLSVIHPMISRIFRRIFHN